MDRTTTRSPSSSLSPSSLLLRRRCPAPLLALLQTVAVLLLLLAPVHAASVPFHNCLPESIVRSQPVRLQFIPLYVSATLAASPQRRTLNVTVYGNVTGLTTREDYPLPDDPRWSNPNVTTGKILNVEPSTNVFTTFFARLDVLSFTVYKANSRPFCETVVQGQCPMGPVFHANASDISRLRAFSFSHDLFSSYSFASILPTFQVNSGDQAGTPIACVAADIVPDLGRSLTNVLTYIPLVVLIIVGFATISAAIFSPWGTSDIFRWTSNYGRDEDLLRLVTPGFGDCLQYIQFIILTSSLTLDYPGFFQPATSKVGWSALMFNESLVSHGTGVQSLQDGLYTVNGTYGLDRMRQYVGMTAPKDVWAGMVVWLLSIIAGVTLLTQLVFSFQWIHRKIAHEPEEDLRSKNLPFTLGNVIRIVFNYFLLPIVSLSMFQFVKASSSPILTVALATLLLVFLVLFAGWLLILIAKTRPRSYLFDDLPTVLLYGPLYNTFSDSAAPFAWISVLLTFIRGIAIGAVQPSGIAQIVLLAICEVTLVLTIAAFRPFEYPTSMNSYYTVLSIIRFLTIILCVAFVPSLEVSASSRGWIGYIILVMHGVVLLFGFFLNAIQTLIEVAARLLGAGGEGGVEGGAARGGLSKVFGMRQLSRRTSRRRHVPRHSINSEAAMLGSDMERPSTQLDGDRARSFSGSSAILLGRPGAGSRMSTGLESNSAYGVANSRGDGSVPYTPTTPATAGAFPGAGRHSGTGSPRTGLVKLKHAETADHFYRPPRQRRATLDGMSPSSQRHTSWGNWSKRDSNQTVGGDEIDVVDGPSVSGRGTPAPAYLGVSKDDPDGEEDPRQPRTDYAVREADFFYRVRGPALSKAPARKLKTGPADPTGPVSSATGWLRGLFRGKTKEQGRGFEVVRSARAPVPGVMLPEEPDVFPEPYRDDPEPAGSKARDAEADAGAGQGSEAETEHKNTTNVAPEAPSLPPIVATDAIELPSRVGTKREPPELQGLRIRPPTIPRRSSKRNSSTDIDRSTDNAAKDTGPHPDSSAESEVETPKAKTKLLQDPGRLPFASKSSSTPSDQISSTSTASSIHHPLDDNPATPRPAHRSRRSGPERYLSKRADRPSSLGYVQQHRASDHIYNANSANSPFSESTAEIVREP